MKKKFVLASALFSVLLLLPAVTADVYVPPGPAYSMDAWISPYLFVIDTQTMMPIGWMYSDGPMYDPVFQVDIPKIEKWEPLILGGPLDIPWSSEVMILGHVPGVAVAPDQVPPPVEIVITWNGIPWVVTLELPPEQIVGYEYPPKFYPDIHDTYEFAWPAESPFKDAYYNVWVGDAAYIIEHLFGVEVPSWWYETFYGMWNGLWFWYRFHPNVGDWIAYNCEGETKFPPTYDITALFEYSTSQIWFPHVAFDVSLLELHKTVDWVNDNELIDVVTIENVGKGPATGLDFIQTFPADQKHGVIPDYASAKARIDGPTRTVGWTTLADFGTSWPYVFQGEFSYLNPGEIMTITMDLSVYNLDEWSGTIVFDSMVSAHEIPPWKYPIGLHSVVIGDPWNEECDEVPLWCGWKLYYDEVFGKWVYNFICEWWVPTPILRDELTHPPPEMVLDPIPVDLDGDGSINDLDVSLVRQAIVGLVAYDHRMDVNVNGEIDTQDLAAYKLAAGG